jgi:hypothetical protein
MNIANTNFTNGALNCERKLHEAVILSAGQSGGQFVEVSGVRSGGQKNGLFDVPSTDTSADTTADSGQSGGQSAGQYPRVKATLQKTNHPNSMVLQKTRKIHVNKFAPCNLLTFTNT